MNRSKLLGRIETRWQALLSSYAGLTDDRMTAPGVIGAWSIKDIIAHVSVWEEEALTHLPVVLAGRRPPRYSVTHGGINTFNALMTQRNRDLFLRDVLRRRDETHRRLLEFVARVPEAECEGDTRFRRRLRLDTYGHYAVHTRAILAWRDGHAPART
ncbi:MAG: DinB family protein [Gammaproteobacteria bacterium]|nr:DinB family protein [Gammaproteobacteria bacterium]